MKMRWDSDSSGESSSSDEDMESSSELMDLNLSENQVKYTECGAALLEKANLKPWLDTWGTRPFNYVSDCFWSALFSILAF